MPCFPRGLLAVAVCVVCLLTAGVARAQLSPEGELKTLRAAPGFEVTLFASEPMITNPAAIDIDTHGRVWVAEIQWYRAGAKSPPADKIKVLEDTDGDGKADRMTVFADGIFAPMSICVAGPKVYVATSPDLWVFEDKDGDLKADGPPTKLLTGFGGRNHDHGAHSLVLGPDHCWWMSHGDAGFDVRGTDDSRIKFTWGAMLRGELDGSRLETVAVNFRNPYELCVSSFGEAFCSDNDNDGNESVRICWIMEGGNYGWFGGPPFGKEELADRLAAETPFRQHWHFRGYIPGYVPATLVTGFGSPTGICFYEGDAFGPRYKNAPLHTDPGPRECRVYRHELDGFGMRGTNEVFLSNEGDNYFRPDDICAAPDGRLYVSDWYDGGVGGHGYNNPEQGRIFLLSPTGKKVQRHEKPGPYANVADAIEGLKSPNLATQFLARERLLSDAAQSVPALKGLLAASEPNIRARALWVLDRLGGEARSLVVNELKSPDSLWRALAVRILRRHGAESAAVILPLARDTSPEVRREVLLTLAKLDSPESLQALVELASAYDGKDRYQLEAIHIAAGARKAELLARLEQNGPLSAAQFPLLQLLDPQRASESLLAQLSAGALDEAAARQALESVGSIPSVEAGWSVLKLTENDAISSKLRRLALERVVANLSKRGNWSAMADDERLADTLARLLDNEDMRPAALTAISKTHLGRLGEPVLAIARNEAIKPAVRRQALDVAAQLKVPGSAEVFRGLIQHADSQVATAALRGLVDLQDIRTLREVLATETYPQELRQKAADRLVDSTGGAIVLLRMIDQQQLPADLQQQVIKKAVAHPDSNVRVLYERFIPEAERTQKLGQSIASADILGLSGDVKRGKEIFNKSSAAQCKQCHAIQGFGGTLGPDLSHIGKKYERAALLETILAPSKAIAPEFVPYLVETTEGQVHVGFLVEQTDDHVVVKDVKNQQVRVARADIAALVPQQKSLMPELVLSEVTAQDAADLLAFLQECK